MIWRLLLCVATLYLGLPMTPTPPDALMVTLRDAQGQGLAGILVDVRDWSGRATLSRATTDSKGQASFAALPTPDVRVAIVGQLADGTRLHHTGNDTLGIALVLTLPPTTLDLRVEPDGTIIPDPGSMITFDSVDSNSLQRRTILTPVPTVGSVPTPPPLSTPPSAPLITDRPDAPFWSGMLLMLGLALMLVLLFMLLWHWRREN